MKKTYRSQNGLHYFVFEFQETGGHIEVYCRRHPPIVGVDSSTEKTHLWPSGRLCFAAGKEPGSQQRADRLAIQWAEYLLDYLRTGVAQN